jgi:excisionase family DNA binding protein
MQVTSPMPATMSVEDAGRLLGVSRRSAYRAVARGEIPSLKVGRRLLVPTHRLLSLLGVPEVEYEHGGEA